MPDVFTFTVPVTETAIDQLGHVNNLVYLQWASLVSKLHWEYLANAEMRRPLLWVMGRQEIDYLQELKIAQQVRIETFVEKVERQKCFRTVLFYNSETGTLVAKAQIIWVLLDAVAKKPMRISEALVKLFEKGR